MRSLIYKTKGDQKMKLNAKRIKEVMQRLDQKMYLASEGDLYSTYRIECHLDDPIQNAEAILDEDYNNLGEEALEQWKEDYHEVVESEEFFIVTNQKAIWNIDKFYCQEYCMANDDFGDLQELHGLLFDAIEWAFATNDLNEAIAFAKTDKHTKSLEQNKAVETPEQKRIKELELEVKTLKNRLIQESEKFSRLYELYENLYNEAQNFVTAFIFMEDKDE